MTPRAARRPRHPGADQPCLSRLAVSNGQEPGSYYDRSPRGKLADFFRDRDASRDCPRPDDARPDAGHRAVRRGRPPSRMALTGDPPPGVGHPRLVVATDCNRPRRHAVAPGPAPGEAHPIARTGFAAAVPARIAAMAAGPVQPPAPGRPDGARRPSPGPDAGVKIRPDGPCPPGKTRRRRETALEISFFSSPRHGSPGKFPGGLPELDSKPSFSSPPAGRGRGVADSGHGLPIIPGGFMHPCDAPAALPWIQTVPCTHSRGADPAARGPG